VTSMSPRARGLTVAGIAAGVGVLAIVVIASQLLPAISPTATAGPTAGPSGTTAAVASSLPSPASSEAPSPTPGDDPLLGLDGRFTLLLLGSDFRPSHPGDRTDAIMIVTINPADRSVAGVSIPRDTVRFPLPNGTVFADKINALYTATVLRVGRPSTGTEMRRIFGASLGIEIDGTVFIGMNGVVELIDSIGGVDVVLDEAVNDPFYWVNAQTQGVHFPAGKNHLDGARALIFARTRQGDSDFQRVRRQQQLVLATAQKVLSRGLDAMPALLTLGEKLVRTDLPLTEAVTIFGLVAAADLEHAQRAVFGPAYATKVPGTSSYELNMTKVGRVMADWFGPLPGSPLGPPATLPPSTPTPSGSPTP
jgi:polyisoprenyl-teichoic acid--peptidoglycan teichoic acid transferase